MSQRTQRTQRAQRAQTQTSAQTRTPTTTATPTPTPTATPTATPTPTATQKHASAPTATQKQTRLLRDELREIALKNKAREERTAMYNKFVDKLRALAKTGITEFECTEDDKDFEWCFDTVMDQQNRKNLEEQGIEIEDLCERGICGWKFSW